MPTDHPPPRRPREPVFNLPGIVLLLVAVLLAIQGYTEFASSQEGARFLLDYAFIPAVWTAAGDPGAAEAVLRAAGAGDPAEAAGRTAFARFVLDEVEPWPGTLLTHALLHGSWTHVVLNGLWLAAFGTPIARRCGAPRFLALVILGAIGGALAHRFTHSLDVVPMVGASAAVSALMAAAARFMFAPGRPGEEVHERPRQSLPALLANRNALFFLGAWFAINLVFGVLVMPFGLGEGSIAWEAHIGGFLVGLLLFPLLDRDPARA